MGKQGKREFVQVLRLMEAFKIEEVTAAVRDAIARGAIGFDAVALSSDRDQSFQAMVITVSKGS
jgi:hypothetical protein